MFKQVNGTMAGLACRNIAQYTFKNQSTLCRFLPLCSSRNSKSPLIFISKACVNGFIGIILLFLFLPEYHFQHFSRSYIVCLRLFRNLLIKFFSLFKIVIVIAVIVIVIVTVIVIATVTVVVVIISAIQLNQLVSLTTYILRAWKNPVRHSGRQEESSKGFLPVT